MTQGYADHGAGLILRIQLIIDIVLVEMIFIDDIFLNQFHWLCFDEAFIG